jgi:hypothetical protein
MRSTRSRVVRIIVALLGAGFVALAWRADLRWCERHMMEFYWAATPELVMRARIWRIVFAAIGVALLAIANPLGKWADRHANDALGIGARYALAIVLALGVSEITMRAFHLPRVRSALRLPEELRIAEPDARCGWVFRGPGVTHVERDGRVIDYAIDQHHNRVHNLTDTIDPSRPTILFAGESITAGFGLEWDETYPALVGDALQTQIVNLGVHAYGNDQSFLRLADALPTFRNPIAIISLYLPSILSRMRLDTHPTIRFDGDAFSVVPPARPAWRDLHLLQVAADVIPYQPAADETLELAANIFKATADLGNARGAKVIFVGPRFGEPRGDQYVIDEIFTRQGLDILDVDIGAERLPNDVHPAQAGTRKLAAAVVDALNAPVPASKNGKTLLSRQQNTILRENTVALP